ncbi:MAG: hypothetical protein WC244_01955 [Patescibacteria group bacterium]|jgi:hypothetical protein
MENSNISRRWEPIDFTVYFRFTWLIAVMAIIVEIAVRLLGNKLGAGIFYDQKEIVAWIIRIIFFAIIGWRTTKVFGEIIMVGAISGSIAGFIIGLVISLYRFGEGFAVWKLFNVFTETISGVVVGAVISMLAVYIISKIHPVK